jgi:8-oxo-dGTP pyrophosphatase MutT (NUDIX family)/phosphohistidine phosphatase SixA
MAKAPGGEIRAAGAVLWRRSSRGIEVALIHRPRYDDWSFPKGKTKAGEHLPETAVREVTEETGIRPVLGRPLPTSRYESDGRPKTVSYWAARPAPGGSDPASSGSFRANDEVDDLRWLKVPEARERLSYPRDVTTLDEFAAGPADTVPFAFLRHCSAGSRDDWPGDDLDRPLDAAGAADAERLAPLLACFGYRRVISSAAQRCVASVRPYAALAGAPVALEPAFTVESNGELPACSADLASAEVAAIVAAGMPAVMCAHRENLPSLLASACAALGAVPPDGSPLPVAGFWILHAAHGLLAAAERHYPAEP